MADIRIIEYLDPRAWSPFAAWFEGLNAPAAAKVTAALYQVSARNWSNVTGVGRSVFERKIDFDTLVILLGGSSKQRQQQAIEAAQNRWADYRRRKATAK